MRSTEEIKEEYERLNQMVNEHLSANRRKGKRWRELSAAYQALCWVVNGNDATMSDGKTPYVVSKPSDCISS